MIRTEEELLAHFVNEGCMLDTETGVVYQSDINLDGEFFGIFVYEPVPEEARSSLDEAIDWIDRWVERDAPGGWFSELADEVIAHPGRFVF